MVRLVNSGTEATMSAIRLARGFTGRDLTVKFEGCYHGHVDSLLVKAGSGVATLGLPDAAGVPRSFAATTIALPYNSVEAVERAFEEHQGCIASVIVEPVAGNMGCVPPAPGFLEALRKITARDGALLIFDEVMTGFPRGVWRRAAALRDSSRPDHARQGDRWRTADRRLRRARRHHGADRAFRPGLPGRHALGQSAGGVGRSGYAPALESAPRNLPADSRSVRRVSWPACRRGLRSTA